MAGLAVSGVAAAAVCGVVGLAVRGRTAVAGVTVCGRTAVAVSGRTWAAGAAVSGMTAYGLGGASHRRPGHWAPTASIDALICFTYHFTLLC